MNWHIEFEVIEREKEDGVEVVTSLLKRIDNLQNNTNKQILQEYHKFLVDCDKSQNSRRNTMKLVLLFSNFPQQQQVRNIIIILIFCK